MKAISFPHRQNFLYCIADKVKNLSIGPWNITEANLLFVSECQISFIQNIFQERRNRVLNRKNDLFWMLMIKDPKKIKNFSDKKSLLGFWDIFYFNMDETNIDTQSRGFYEISQSIMKLEKLWKATLH